MAILDGLEILLEDAILQEPITELHTEESHQSTTVRKVARCIEVVNGQQCSFKVKTLPNFQWHDGDCLRESCPACFLKAARHATDPRTGLILDFDAGETINRYELYLLRDLQRVRRLVSKESILRRAALDNCQECIIDYFYIRSDISDAYCQKGRLVFRNLRQGTTLRYPDVASRLTSSR